MGSSKIYVDFQKSKSASEKQAVCVKGAANAARQQSALLISGFDSLTKSIHTLTSKLSIVLLKEGTPIESQQERRDSPMESHQVLTKLRKTETKNKKKVPLLLRPELIY